MFAYCLNDPVNYEDGQGALAYPGEVHQEVIKRIVAKYALGRNLQTEVWVKLSNGGLGRADLIDFLLGEVWEVKRNRRLYVLQGERQVKNYKQGTVLRPGLKAELVTGKMAFEDTFEFTAKDGKTYSVEYHTQENGIIVYDYQEIRTAKAYTQPVTEAAFVMAMGGAFFLTCALIDDIRTERLFAR